VALQDILLNNEYIRSLLILVLTVLISEIFLFIIKKYVHKITLKTKTEIDDVILNNITKPLHILIILIGLYLALRSLSIFDHYLIWINKFSFILFVFIISFILTKILSVLVTSWLKVKKKYEKTPQLFNKIITVIIYIIATLIILDFFDIQLTPLVAALGLGGLAVGLALQDTISNFFAGLHIISDRPVNVGDYIEIEGNLKGYVEDIGWRTIRIKTLPNTIVIIPNKQLAESKIINYSMPQKEMSALVQVGVSYDSDLKKVERVTIDVAKQIQKTIKGGIKDFQPFIRYHTFSDSNINFSVILRVETFIDKYLVTHEFIKALKERYYKEKIEISWPVRKVYSYKGK
jgi:small-conductance mechanosensitive channel|tara:strand:- start:12247 stop:13287 length:1041 start_codon:yes stop_codon:yes gene_type:complete